MYTMYKQCSVSSSVEEGTQTTPPPVKIGLTKSTSTLLKPISRLSRNNSQRMLSPNKKSSLDNANTVSFLKETFCRNTIQKVPIARIEMIVKKKQKLPKLKLSNNFRIQCNTVRINLKEFFKFITPFNLLNNSFKQMFSRQ